MKIKYGENRRGKITFEVDHKFGKLITLQDQQTMVIERVIKKFQNAGNFEFYKYLENNDDLARPENSKHAGMICGGKFTIN